MSDTFTPEHAHKYTNGVDRSPTEIAALALADSPGIDPVQFLTQACGLDPDEAAEAVALIPGYAPGEPVKAKRTRGARPAADPAVPADAGTGAPVAGAVTGDGSADPSADAGDNGGSPG